MYDPQRPLTDTHDRIPIPSIILVTLAVTGLEVAMVGFVMFTGDEKPTLARDTMLAVVMLVINGFMGLALLLGCVHLLLFLAYMMLMFEG
ncbi:MAG: hypothetical protein WCS43_13140 [Verrucomicrobiota bacterium]